MKDKDNGAFPSKTVVQVMVRVCQQPACSDRCNPENNGHFAIVLPAIIISDSLMLSLSNTFAFNLYTVAMPSPITNNLT